MLKNTKRVGFYAWAGPGLIRMTALKYFDAAVDRASMMTTYTPEYLAKVQGLFGVTDLFATFSWGFSDAIETEDREFFISHLDGMHALGLRVHAYVQGPNVVHRDFEHEDMYCRTTKGDLIPYHRGRKSICLQNPAAREFLLSRIQVACRTEADGVFVDNLFFGQLGLPGAGNGSAVGCACPVCKKAYGHDAGRLSRDYLAFRTDTVRSFLSDAASLVHSYGKEFGTNALDPFLPTEEVYGYRLADLAKYQDYLLFENVRLLSGTSYIGEIATQYPELPVFGVSYKKGIGFDGSFTQQDVDSVFVQAERYGYSPCLKGSEFLTKGVWHNLRPEEYRTPDISHGRIPCMNPRKSTETQGSMKRMVSFYIPRIATVYFENQFARYVLSPLERRVLA